MKAASRPETAGRLFGFSERFRPGDKMRAEAAIRAMTGSGAKLLRLPLDSTDLASVESGEWLDWLVPRLAEAFDLLPMLDLAGASLDAGPDDGSAAEVLDTFIRRHGSAFRFLELRISDVPGVLRTASDDPSIAGYRSAIRHLRDAGQEPVLTGSVQALHLAAAAGLLSEVAVVGVVDERAGEPWAAKIAQVRDLLARNASAVEIWITEATESGDDEVAQLRVFADALASPADRVYWRCWEDADASWHGAGDRDSGAIASGGRPRLLARLLAKGGFAEVRRTADLAAPRLGKAVRPIAIVGGSGFVGCNLADSFLAEGSDVLILDNLSRPGVERNLDWLLERYGERVHPVIADVREAGTLEAVLADAGAVFHFAAQVAVTTSLERPVDDFEVNARGTLNVLEALRRAGARTPIVFASTNKVYGGLDDLPMAEAVDRYHPADNEIHAHGIGEGRNLDFCTPYGCSKGVADQYVLDYAKSYGVPSAVLRMSCIYGPRQFGTEDQGWVAHFLIRALEGEAITIYGDGKQVRDVLHVSDAVAAYRAVLANIEAVKGQAFNLGGGPRNAVSLRMVLNEIARLTGAPVATAYGEWRAGDQLYFVADTRKIEAALGWRAEMGWQDGIADLYTWLCEQRDMAPSLGSGQAPVGKQARRLSA